MPSKPLIIVTDEATKRKFTTKGVVANKEVFGLILTRFQVEVLHTLLNKLGPREIREDAAKSLGVEPSSKLGHVGSLTRIVRKMRQRANE